jgi:RNA polymerase sigma factor (sigma-70 family)
MTARDMRFAPFVANRDIHGLLRGTAARKERDVGRLIQLCSKFSGMADPRVQPRAADEQLTELVRAAADGDQSAWDEIVARYAGLVWGVARALHLNEADAADVSQTTWLRLAEHLKGLREPSRLGGWLASTARHEAYRILRRAKHIRTADLDSVERDVDGPDGRILREERDAELWRAFGTLSAPCQTLLRTLIVDPKPSYAEVSEALGMPVGSIGPRRKRCIQHLRSCTHLRDDLPVQDRRESA